MKKSRIFLIAAGTAMVLTLAGCGTKEEAPEITPTPVPTATPTAVPATVTPAPTATPAPRVIGVKTSQSKFIYLTNDLGTNLREIYLKVSGTEEWGKNLIPSESIVQDNEQVQMYYSSGTTAVGSELSAETSSGEGGSSDSSLYDMKVVTADGNTYEIYSIATDDMEKATLTMDEDSGVAYLRYMSLSSNSEMDTRENSQQTGYGEDSDESYDYTEEYYDSTQDDYYDDSSDDYYDDSSDDSYDDSSDGSYDDSSDGSYDDSSDGSYDDSSDGSYDDSSDDSYDDSSDDSYDDGSDDSYVDAGGDSGDSGYEDGADYVDDEEVPWDYQ